MLFSELFLIRCQFGSHASQLNDSTAGGSGALQPVFTTGAADYKLVTVTRPADSSLDKVAVEAADDFYVTDATTIQGDAVCRLWPE